MKSEQIEAHSLGYVKSEQSETRSKNLLDYVTQHRLVVDNPLTQLSMNQNWVTKVACKGR